MATRNLSVDKKKYSILGWNGQASWSDWVTPSGSNTTWPEYHYMVFHKVNLYKGADVQALNSIKITVPVSSSNGVSGGIQAVLFESDVTGTETFPSGGHAFPYSEINLGAGRSTTYSATVSLSGITADTVYIGYNALYSSGEMSVDSGGTTIVETYTESPPISFGTVTADNSGLHIPINYGNNVALTCRITAGNTDYPGNNEELYSGTSSSGRFDVPIEAPNDVIDWFNTAAITDSFIIPITITVTGGNPSPITKGLRYVEDRAAAKESMRPTVSSITKLIQQPDGFPSDYAETYIAGFSKCKLTAVITRPTDALVSTVTLSYPGGRTVTMTPVSGSTDEYEGTTSSALAQDTTFTVTVTDARGLSNTGTESVAGVVPYVLPSVSIDPANTYRCNSQGVKTDGGDHYKIRVTPQISTIIIDSDTGNDTNYITELTVGLKSVPDGTPGRYPIPTNGNISDTLPPVSAAAANTLSQPKQAYVLTVIIQDRISGQVIREYTLKGLQRDLVLNHDGGHTHLGVGMTPVGKDISGYKDTIELPSDGLFLLGGIPAQAFNYPHIAGRTSTDPCFGHDFLNVAADRTGEANATAIFGFPASDYSSWSNLPDDPFDHQSPASGIRTYGWVGWREVYYINQDVCIIKITEVAPKIGRVWFCSRGRNATTHEYEWSLWCYLMPTAVNYAGNS